MVYEFTSTDSDTYTYGHRLLYSDDVKYVLNAHGDVVALLKDVEYEDLWHEGEDGNNLYVTYTVTEVVKRYDYDAFGNELNPSESDTNPFRYCAEYFDVESGQIYLRARYYQPIVGRFSQRDTHWNTANMIYGDEVKIKEYEDYLGLNKYTVKLVDYAAIRQSGNLYGYCLNNPLYYFDYNGESVVAGIAALIIGGAALFLTGCSAQDSNAWLAQNQAAKVQANANTPTPPSSIYILDSQLGAKYGKHKNEFPNMSHLGYKNTAIDIFNNPNYIYYDSKDNEFIYIRGDIIVRVKPDGEFISMYPNSQSSTDQRINRSQQVK